jgi:putative hydrolase of the HAD superfamily
MTIKTIFFDMGGTIETFWYSPEMRLTVTPDLLRLLSSYGLDFHLTEKQLYEMVTSGLLRYHHWRLTSMDELPASQVWRNYIFAEFPGEIPQLESIADELMVWIETHYYQRQMRPEMPKVLNAIQRMGYKIGLISNVSSKGQVPLNLKKYGIIQYFNPIVLSSEYKRRKPDPSIFHYAARLSNTPTSECIYIGDRISRDVLGAKRAGFKLAIKIKHEFNHGESDEGAIPDFTISNMNELLEILAQDYQASLQAQNEEIVPRKVKALLFDAAGVLYYRKNRDQEMNDFIKQHSSQSGRNLEAEINQLRHQSFIGEITFEQYESAILRVYGITDPNLVSEGIATALKEKDEVLFFNETLKTLKNLKAHGLYLGIVTDTAQPLHKKLNKLERGGIGNLWDSIIPSNEVGVQKPDPKIYQQALQQLGIRADQAIFVGHKSSELEGAKNIGMATVGFNCDPDAKADYYLDSFSDLQKLPILV